MEEKVKGGKGRVAMVRVVREMEVTGTEARVMVATEMVVSAKGVKEREGMVRVAWGVTVTEEMGEQGGTGREAMAARVVKEREEMVVEVWEEGTGLAGMGWAAG